MNKIRSIIQDPRSALFAVFAVTVLAYSNIFWNGFTLDDFDYIANWPLIRDWHNLPRFFSGFIPPDGQSAVYAPLKTVVHCVLYQLGSGLPWAFQLAGLLAHLAATSLVYRIALLLLGSRPVAFLSALLFGLHPVHAEAVTHMTAATDTLGVVWMLASFYFYIRSSSYSGEWEIGEKAAVMKTAEARHALRESAGGTRPQKAYVLAVIFAFLAVYTSELAMTLPVLFFIFDACVRRGAQGWNALCRRAAPFAGAVLSYALLKWLVLGEWTRSGYLHDSFYLTFLVFIKAAVKYAGILLCPAVLTHNHIISPGIFSFAPKDFNAAAVLSQSPKDPWTMASILVLAVFAAGALALRKKKPFVAFAVAWFFILLLPASNIIPGQIYFAERYAYASSAAFCILLAYGLYAGWLARPAGWGRTAVVVLVAGIAGFYLARTWLRNTDWHDQAAIYESAVRANRQSALLRHDLGVVYLYRGDMDSAVTYLEEAIWMRPNEAAFYFSAEQAYSALGQFDKAIQSLQKAVELNPEFAEAYYNLAGIHLHLGRDQEAQSYLAKALEQYRRQGRILEAGEALNKVLVFKAMNKK
ncbi:MAG: tetratricopeptide repeat protein [Candidatus Omnitrophota bacterium]|nr:tetratricopeptide repeat protein [Candidatus Omnitrophota bacterium]MDZ4242296.1 tetratricopeptide repeat protein [Candidatus Omnitrophota bacterium]